jgi:hypothetical protein
MNIWRKNYKQLLIFSVTGLLWLCLSDAMNASTLLAEFDSESSASQSYLTVGVGMGFGLHYGSLSHGVGDHITAITGDAFVGFDSVYMGQGQFDFNEVNSPKFSNFVSYLTNNMNDTLWKDSFTFTSDGNMTVPSTSGGGPENFLFAPNTDLSGKDIDFVRLIVNSVSVTHDEYSQTSSWNVTWQFWGSDITPVPEPSTMLLLGSGLLGLIALRRRFKN